MKRQLYEAYDSLRPDQEARQRMLQNILSQAPDSQPAGKDVPMKRKQKRMVLIAALVALTVMLAGCATAVLLNLKNLSIAQEVYVENPYYEKDGTKIPAAEKVRDTISLQGLAGSTNQKAAQEWREFEKNYDPNYEKAEEDFSAPADYQAYHLYNAEMLEKVQEICDKYGLKPAGAFVMAQNWQTDIFFEALQMDGLLKPDALAEMEYLSGYFYTGGNFNMEFHLTLTNSQWTHPILGNMRYNGKGYLDTVAASVNQEVTEWTHTLADGTQLLVIQAEDYARIFCDREDAFLSVRIETTWDEQIMTAEDIQQIAEALDFTIKPQKPDMAVIQPKLDAAEAAYLAQQEALLASLEAEPWEDPFAKESYAELVQSLRENEDEAVRYMGSYSYTDLTEKGAYALLDVTGDGEEELLLGKDGALLSVWLMRDGKTVSLSGSDELFLCEGSIMGQYAYREDWLAYSFWSLEGAEIGNDGTDYVEYDNDVAYVGYSAYEGTWKYIDYSKGEEAVTVTEDEAMEIVNSFVRLEIPWKPLRDFPMN